MHLPHYRLRSLLVAVAIVGFGLRLAEPGGILYLRFARLVATGDASPSACLALFSDGLILLSFEGAKAGGAVVPIAALAVFAATAIEQRQPRRRLTIARMMAAVGLFALLAAIPLGARLRYLSIVYRTKAANCQGELDSLERSFVIIGDVRLTEEENRARYTERVREVTHYWSRLKAKYEWAARYPWLPVAPDPTPPE